MFNSITRDSEPDARMGNEKFWLVPNEVEGYSILLPSEY